jgi:hypothetical protein
MLEKKKHHHTSAEITSIKQHQERLIKRCKLAVPLIT